MLNHQLTASAVFLFEYIIYSGSVLCNARHQLVREMFNGATLVIKPGAECCMPRQPAERSMLTACLSNC